VFGEVGLAGEIRGVPHAALRVKEAVQLGFTQCIVPASNLPLPEAADGCSLVSVRSVGDALEELLAL